MKQTRHCRHGLCPLLTSFNDRQSESSPTSHILRLHQGRAPLLEFRSSYIGMHGLQP